MTGHISRQQQADEEQQQESPRPICIHIPAEALRNAQGGVISITLVIDPSQGAIECVQTNKHHVEASTPLAPCAQLSPRERQVLHMVALGLDNTVIAQRLGIARGTVCNHLRTIYEKLGVTSRTAAACWAWERGLIAS